MPSPILFCIARALGGIVNNMKRGKIIKRTKPFNLEQEVRGAGIMMEHIDGKLTLVSEILGVHTKALDSHTKMLEAQAQLLEKHSQKLDLHTEMIGNAATDITVIKSDIEFIKHGLKKKVDVDEFATLERRVAVLEKHR